MQLATELSDFLTDNVTQMRQALQRGILTGLELSAAETAHINARTNRLELEKQVRQQQLAFNRLVGLPPDSAIPLERSIALPARLVPPTLEWFLKGLEDRRLDLVALRQGYASQEATVRAAILSQFSNIAIGFYDDLANFYRPPGPQISADLPIFNRNQGNIAIERATRQNCWTNTPIASFKHAMTSPGCSSRSPGSMIRWRRPRPANQFYRNWS